MLWWKKGCEDGPDIERAVERNVQLRNDKRHIRVLESIEIVVAKNSLVMWWRQSSEVGSLRVSHPQSHIWSSYLL